MSFDRLASGISDSTPSSTTAPAPGKRARTDSLAPQQVQRSAVPTRDAGATQRAVPAFANVDLAAPFALHLTPVQRAAERAATAADHDSTEHVQAAAARGTAGPGGPLPHAAAIQRSFGPTHDISNIKAHVGGAAATAAEDMGAHAFATGSHVAFTAQPDLHLAAHEAAHVIQQQGGVSLKGGVGQAGDAYEQHADAVADAVVAGRSAEALLAPYALGGGGSSAVQRKGAEANQVKGNAKDLANDSVGLTSALSVLQDADVDARDILAKLRSRKITLAAALAGLAVTIRGTYAALQTFATAHDVTELDGHWRAEARAALDSIARTALTMMPEAVNLTPLPGTDAVMPIATPIAPEDAARAAELQSALTTLAILGESVDWTQPKTAEQALRALQAHEMCPTGASDEGLSGCKLRDSERVELRGNLRVDAIHALDAFRRACEPHHARLDSMIARERALREKIIGTFVSTIATGLAAEAVAAVAIIDTSVGAPWEPGEVGNGETVQAATFAHTLGQKVATAAAYDFAGPAAGEGTKGMLDALVEAMRSQLEEAVDGVKALSDSELRKAANGMRRLTKPEVYATPLKSLVDAYQAQIDPLGNGVGAETRARLNLPPGTYFTYMAVRVSLPSGPRLAQVAHEANTTPTDGPTKGRTDHRYVFVKWIDEQFAEVVGDAPTLPLNQIEGLSVGDIVATTSGAGA